jgi:SSS family solute:Na+ symporter
LPGGELQTAYTDRQFGGCLCNRRVRLFPSALHDHPFLYLTIPRLRADSHSRGYITAGDLVLDRYGDRWLDLAVALTGIVATMLYIALHLMGLEKVVRTLGFLGEGSMQHVPITIAFVILALYTYRSGLRAPAMIAFAKDTIICIFVIAAVVIIPYELGRFAKIFEAARAA